MIRKNFIAIIIVFTAWIFCYGTGYKSDWQILSTGGGLASKGGSYKNEVANTGQTITGNARDSVSHISSDLGFVAAFVTKEATQLSFYNQVPSPDTELKDYPVRCEITIESFGAAFIDTTTVRYRISNNGTDPSNFTSFISDARVKETITAGKKITYYVDIPTAATSNISFKPGSDNYIQWRAWAVGGSDGENSGMFNVSVANTGIEIVQPVDFSSMHPVFEAAFEGPVNPATINVKIERVSTGEELVNESGNAQYNTVDKTYKNQWLNLSFIAGAQYKYTMQVQDVSGATLTDSSLFIVNDGAIADLIPFPSPFNPDIQGVSIRYVLDKESTVSINIYDASGELVYVLTDGEIRNAGLNKNDIWYAINYAQDKLANGIYFCEIIAEDADGEHRRYTSLAVLR